MMVLTRTSETDYPSSQENGLSDYEKLRLEKIKRNEDRMRELGLFESREALAESSKKKKAKTKKTPQISLELPKRRSTRKRKKVVDYSHEQVIPMSSDDDGSVSNDVEKEEDYEVSDDEDEDEEDEMEVEEPRKKRSKPIHANLVTSSSSKSPKSDTKKTAVDTSFDCVNPKGGLALEYAKTGRSTCRKCKNKIEKGKPRVGMEAWIVGRNAMTWQRPQCLLQNMRCLYEKSNGGKAKCKASNVSFAKGQLKIGIRCHTATSYYHIESFGKVLSNVVSLMRTEDGCENFVLTVDGIDGHEKLKDEDRQALESVLEMVFQNPASSQKIELPTKASKSPTHQGTSETDIKQEGEVEHKNEEQAAGIRRDQPKAGEKTGAKGRVEWKFGGRSCYGTLIPRMETKSHCYARTHKGNIKTLAKGKDYWSVWQQIR